MNDWDLNTGERQVGGGLERYTFQLPATFFRHAKPETIKHSLTQVYCVSPRPDAREILDVSVAMSGDAARVTLVIQRGHYLLAKLVREHEHLTFHRDEGYAECTCHPGVRHPLVMSSIPDYGEEL